MQSQNSNLLIMEPDTKPGIVVHRRWQSSVLTFLMVFGPGLIVMEADNDAGAVSTYVQAGGQYGLHLLWILLLLLPITYFVQEMVARLGIATGKGHAASRSFDLCNGRNSAQPRHHRGWTDGFVGFIEHERPIRKPAQGESTER